MTKQPPPDRIYGWLDTHLSIARLYGGIQFQGEDYIIDEGDIDQPLVRRSVLVAELAAKKKAKASLAKASRAKQVELI